MNIKKTSRMEKRKRTLLAALDLFSQDSQYVYAFMIENKDPNDREDTDATLTVLNHNKGSERIYFDLHFPTQAVDVKVMREGHGLYAGSPFEAAEYIMAASKAHWGEPDELNTGYTFQDMSVGLQAAPWRRASWPQGVYVAQGALESPGYFSILNILVDEHNQPTQYFPTDEDHMATDWEKFKGSPLLPHIEFKWRKY